MNKSSNGSGEFEPIGDDRVNLPSGVGEVSDEWTAVDTARLEVSDEDPDRELCLVVIQGGDVARRYRIDDEPQLMGRGEECAIRLTGKGISRTHSRILKVGPDVIIADLESTNGTWINGKRTPWAQLKHGDRVALGDTILKVLDTTDLDTAYHDEVYRLTTTDDHTGAFNRRYFFQTLQRELARAIRHDRPLALLMLDVDDLREINAQRGPLAGDAVLLQLASRVSAGLRTEDVIARVGGDEFCVLLPETDHDGASAVAKRLSREIERTSFMYDDEALRVSSSIGIATIDDLDGILQFKGNRHNAHRCLDAFIEVAARRSVELRQKGLDAEG